MSKAFLTKKEYNELLDQFAVTRSKIGFEDAVKEAFNTVYELLYELSKQIEAMGANVEDEQNGQISSCWMEEI